MFFKKNESKRRLKKLLKQDLTTIVAVNPEEYMDERDKKTLAALKAIPFFDKLCAAFISAFNEPLYTIQDTSSKILISEKQIPRVYNMLLNITKKLGIEMPKLYLELDRQPDAYTYGNEFASITVTSGLLECMEDEQLYAVLAHECGHIACKHVLYRTMGRLILNGGVHLLDGNGVIGKLISTPLKLAFFRWMRCSEFSADRAAAICCENAQPVVETMMRLAGGTSHVAEEIDVELFMGQAESYQEMVDESKWNKMLEFFILHQQSHPLLSVRAKASAEWAQSKKFQALVSAMKGE